MPPSGREGDRVSGGRRVRRSETANMDRRSAEATGMNRRYFSIGWEISRENIIGADLKLRALLQADKLSAPSRREPCQRSAKSSR